MFLAAIFFVIMNIFPLPFKGDSDVKEILAMLPAGIYNSIIYINYENIANSEICDNCKISVDMDINLNSYIEMLPDGFRREFDKYLSMSCIITVKESMHRGELLIIKWTSSDDIMKSIRSDEGASALDIPQHELSFYQIESGANKYYFFSIEEYVYISQNIDILLDIWDSYNNAVDRFTDSELGKEVLEIVEDLGEYWSVRIPDSRYEIRREEAGYGIVKKQSDIVATVFEKKYTDTVRVRQTYIYESAEAAERARGLKTIYAYSDRGSEKYGEYIRRRLAVTSEVTEDDRDITEVTYDCELLWLKLDALESVRPKVKKEDAAETAGGKQQAGSSRRR